jgi:hypothetical protein
MSHDALVAGVWPRRSVPKKSLAHVVNSANARKRFATVWRSSSAGSSLQAEHKLRDIC